MEVRPLVSHTSSNLPADVDINLCLLECLLRQAKCEATTEETLQNSNVTLSSPDSFASDSQVNQNSRVSSEQTSVPENNSSFPESDNSFTPTKSLPDSLTSVRSIKESYGHLSLDQSDSDISSYRHLSSEEGIVKSCCGPDRREAKQFDDLHHLQSSTAECNSVSSVGNSIFPVDQKTDMQHVHTSTESSVANSSMVLLNNQTGHLDFYQHHKQGPAVELHESISRPSSAASSEGSGLETVSSDFENVLTASQEKCFELQLEIKQLEEQLKQSEDEKQKLQVDLGKYLFLEENNTKKAQQLEDLHQLQSSTTECNTVSRDENSIFHVDQKTGTQHVRTNTDSSVANSSMLLPNDQTDHLDLYQNQRQGQCFDLQLEIKQLEDQLKQSEQEKQKLQVDLGKYLFLEEKEKRRGRLLAGAALLHESG